jgi:holliday junction resolvase YEN1
VRIIQNHSNVLTFLSRSLWFCQCQVPFRYAHAQAGENPELRTLFFRLARLLRTCVAAIFVFDGIDRPPMKRGKKVIKKAHWLEDAFKDLIESFGFAHHTVCRFFICGGAITDVFSFQAPGEAEAELARLNCMGLISAVLSDDSDTFVFGATTVIRKYDCCTSYCNVTNLVSAAQV